MQKIGRNCIITFFYFEICFKAEMITMCLTNLSHGQENGQPNPMLIPVQHGHRLCCIPYGILAVRGLLGVNTSSCHGSTRTCSSDIAAFQVVQVHNGVWLQHSGAADPSLLLGPIRPPLLVPHSTTSLPSIHPHTVVSCSSGLPNDCWCQWKGSGLLAGMPW